MNFINKCNLLFTASLFAVLLISFSCINPVINNYYQCYTSAEPPTTETTATSTTTTTIKIYNLRDTGPAGGLVFYDKGNYTDGWRYLEAAPLSTEGSFKLWGKSGTSVSDTGTSIGTGRKNTERIVAVLNAPPAESDLAAQLCDALSYGGYNDWFLPSKDELNQMYVNLKSHHAGDFGNGDYWSSSENQSQFAWCQDFSNGIQYSHDKNSTKWGVRAVRAF